MAKSQASSPTAVNTCGAGAGGSTNRGGEGSGIGAVETGSGGGAGTTSELSGVRVAVCVAVSVAVGDGVAVCGGSWSIGSSWRCSLGCCRRRGSGWCSGNASQDFNFPVEAIDFGLQCKNLGFV